MIEQLPGALGTSPPIDMPLHHQNKRHQPLAGGHCWMAPAALTGQDYTPHWVVVACPGASASGEILTKGRPACRRLIATFLVNALARRGADRHRGLGGREAVRQLLEVTRRRGSATWRSSIFGLDHEPRLEREGD